MPGLDRIEFILDCSLRVKKMRIKFKLKNEITEYQDTNDANKPLY